RTVIDCQPDFARLRRKVRDDRAEPLNIRRQSRIEPQRMQRGHDDEAVDPRVRPQNDRDERRQPAESDDQGSHRCSSSRTDLRSAIMTRKAIALRAATPRKNQATYRTGDPDIANHAEAMNIKANK